MSGMSVRKTKGTDVSDDESDDENEIDEETFEPEIEVEEELYRTRSGRRVKPKVRHAGIRRPSSDPHYIKGIPSFRRDAYMAGANPRKKIRSGVLQHQFLQSLDWDTTISNLKSRDSRKAFTQMLRSYDPLSETIEDWSPLALAAKSNDADNPTWNQAMNGPNADGFREACQKEYDTLTRMKVWDIVKRRTWMNIIPGTWAFKVKRFPDNLIRKLKARFCARGDKQIAQVDFFDTYAPVVCWTTVRLMLVLAIQLDLANRQVDYTAAFVHAPIDKDPNWDKMTEQEKERSGVFIQMPRGFTQEGKVLKLKQSRVLATSSNISSRNLKEPGSNPMTALTRVCLFQTK